MRRILRRLSCGEEAYGLPSFRYGLTRLVSGLATARRVAVGMPLG